MSVLRTVVLIAATMATGLAAGVFGLYSHTIMRGLGATDDRTFVGAFQAVDRAILNPWFMLSFVGALAFTGLAAALHLGQDVRAVLPWIIVALVLYLVAFIITGLRGGKGVPEEVGLHPRAFVTFTAPS
ncbi:hypothetical protein ABT267_42565, partial [Nonomuraea sp. NPDC001023]